MLYLDVLVWPMVAAGVGAIVGAVALAAVAVWLIVKLVKKRKGA